MKSLLSFEINENGFENCAVLTGLGLMIDHEWYIH